MRVLSLYFFPLGRLCSWILFFHLITGIARADGTNPPPFELETNYPTFSVVIVPDTQNIMQQQNSNLWSQTVEWIETNKTLNTTVVLGVGDCVDGANETNQWDTYRHGLANFTNTPFVMAAGNHDVSYALRDYTIFNHFLSSNYFASKPWWASVGHGFLIDGQQQNMYITITNGVLKMLVGTLEFGPTTNQVLWFSNVCASYPDHLCFLTTHNYMNRDGSLNANGDLTNPPHSNSPLAGGLTDSCDGRSMYALLKGLPNLVLITCGHHICSPNEAFRTDIAPRGNFINGQFVNYQCDQYSGGPNHGKSMSRLKVITFHPGGTGLARTFDASTRMWTNSFHDHPVTISLSDPRIAREPITQHKEIMHTATFEVTAAGTPPFQYHWYKDGVPLAGNFAATLVLTNLQSSQAGNYFVIFTNGGGSVTSTPASLTVTTPTMGGGFGARPDFAVHSIVRQPDGRILTGGGPHPFNNISRFNSDGTLDAGFNPRVNGTVYSLSLQTDGGIIVGGDFGSLAGQSRDHLGRLHADGALDAGFNVGADAPVRALLVQTDNGIVVGGEFNELNGQNRQYFARLSAGGTLDTNFNLGADGAVYCLAAQADGGVLLGGEFTSLNHESRSFIARLGPSGVLDAGFAPQLDGPVFALAVQSDGKILLGGDFNNVNGQTRMHIARLNTDGTLDSGFNAGADSAVHALAVQPTGRVLVGGHFSKLNGQTCNHIGRFNTNGTLETSFNPSANQDVLSLTQPAGSRILVGGRFTSVAGEPCYYLTWLQNFEPYFPPQIMQSDAHFGFVTNGFDLSLTGAEGWGVVVESSTNLVNWLPRQTNTFSGSPIYFNDPNTAGSRFCFYRLRTITNAP